MARWSASSAAVLGALGLLYLAATMASAQGQGKGLGLPPGNMQVITMGNKRNSKFTCADTTKKKRPGCSATCPSRCPKKCLVLCPTCKTFCRTVRLLSRRVVRRPALHRRRRQQLLLPRQEGPGLLHRLRRRPPHQRPLHRQAQPGDEPRLHLALGVRFAHHTLLLGATKTAKWDPAADHLTVAFDDEDIVIPAFTGARWSPTTAPALSVTRTAQANTVVVELKGVFRIVANVVPITAEDSRIHNYGVTDDDSLAHLDLGFKFYDLTDDVHGVLGQTYRPDYVNRLDVAAKMPVMGGADSFVSSGLFATDCAVARFGRTGAGAGAGIAMVTEAN
ncbi:hypothetical protein ACP70R_034984 [Stipagrostis hirtigluma subsp. patula]